MRKKDFFFSTLKKSDERLFVARCNAFTLFADSDAVKNVFAKVPTPVLPYKPLPALFSEPPSCTCFLQPDAHFLRTVGAFQDR